MAEAFPDAPSTLSTDNPQVLFILWGDSHLANNHFFPTEFQKLIDFPGSRYSPNLINNAVGGRRLNASFINNIQTFAGNQENDKHYVHIVFVGGNNIRDCFRPGATQSPSDTVQALIEHHNTIFDILTTKPKTKVLLISPLPSSHPDHEPYFEWLGLQLENLARQKGAYFARVRDLLSTTVGFDQNGLAIREYVRDLFHDDVHLNQSGAKILAKRVFSVINNIPNSDFGYYKLRGNRKQQAN